MKKISSLGEFRLIHQLTQGLKLNENVVIGPGDDCAVVRVDGRRLLLTTDLLIEKVHFRRDWMTAREIGFKAMRVNLSDIAAMGGRPLYALISLGLPKSSPVSFARNLFRGLRDAAEEAGCSIVGGDTDASDRVIINVALIGEAEKIFLTRHGARAGDDLYVTGTLGGSALGLKALQKKRRKGFEPFIRNHVTPPLRIKVGQFLTRLRGVHALIDLSDGLAGDLRHVLDQSGVGAMVEIERIPVPKGFAEFARRARALKIHPVDVALAGGEDYELLFAASPRVKMAGKIHGVPITKIGRITRKTDLRFISSKGRILSRGRGYRHF